MGTEYFNDIEETYEDRIKVLINKHQDGHLTNKELAYHLTIEYIAYSKIKDKARELGLS